MPRTSKRAVTKRAARIAKTHAANLPQIGVREVYRSKSRPARGMARFPWVFAISFLAILTVIIVFISVDRGTSAVSGAVTYQPPFVPLSFSINTNGVISVQGDLSVVTLVGTFSVSGNVSEKLEPEDNTLILVIRHKQSDSVIDTVYRIQTGQKEVIVVTNGKTTIGVTQNRVLIDDSKGNIQTIEVKDNNTSIFPSITSLEEA